MVYANYQIKWRPLGLHRGHFETPDLGMGIGCYPGGGGSFLREGLQLIFKKIVGCWEWDL